MLVFTSPNQVVKHALMNGTVVQLWGYPCNHNIMDFRKLSEITNNMMGNSLEVKLTPNQNWVGDIVIFMGYNNKV